MYKIRLCEELAKHDEKGYGYEYEIWEMKNNPKKVQVRFKDTEGVWRYVTYRKGKVESFIKAGDWIPTTPTAKKAPSARQLFDEMMALDK